MGWVKNCLGSQNGPKQKSALKVSVLSSYTFLISELRFQKPNKMETNNITEILKADQVQCTSGSEIGKKSF